MEKKPEEKKITEKKPEEKKMTEKKPEEKKRAEEKKLATEEGSEKEKRDLREVDEKLAKLTAGIKVDKKPAIAQLAQNAPRVTEKAAMEENYEQDHFE